MKMNRITLSQQDVINLTSYVNEAWKQQYDWCMALLEDKELIENWDAEKIGETREECFIRNKKDADSLYNLLSQLQKKI